MSRPRAELRPQATMLSAEGVSLRDDLTPPARPMMSQHWDKRLGCADFRRSLSVDRRSFLKAGMLGASGLTLPQLLRYEAQGGAGSRINNVIILWMRGGPSHIDMWDVKPDAPAE